MLEVPLLDLMKDNAGHARKFKRYWVNFPVSVQAATEEAMLPVPAPEGLTERLPALTHNISLSGIAFLCAGLYHPTELIEIEITLEAQTHLLLARIRRRRELDLPGEPMYHYGTQFVRTEAALRFIPIAAEFLLAQGGARRVGCVPRRTPSLTSGTVPVG